MNRKSNNNKSHCLARVVFEDICKFGKLSLLLFMLIVVASFAVLATTHKVRLLHNEQEQLMLQREMLESEWRNLILEENVLGDNKRIEKIALKKLGMQQTSSDNETIIKIKRTK